MISSSLKYCILLLLLLVGLQGYAPAQDSPDQDENSEKSDDPVVEQILEQFDLWDDVEASAYVEEIGRQLLTAVDDIPKSVEFKFILLDEDSVNAFAMPKGQIFIFRGLVERAETEDQLASVIAHEMVHVLHKHHGKGQDTLIAVQLLSILAAVAAKQQEPVIAGQMISSALVESYGRDAEVDADLGGIDLMIKAGYDPIATLEFFSYMEGLERRHPQLPGNYFSIHPYALERMDILKEHLTSLGVEIPENIYRLHLTLDQVCEQVDDHFECSVYVADIPVFTIAGDDSDQLNERGYEILHNLREAFSAGIRDYQVYSRETGGVLYLEALGSPLITVTPLDEKYLDGGRDKINADRLEKIKYILWKYYVERSI